MVGKRNFHYEASIRKPVAHPVIEARFTRKNLQRNVSVVMERMMFTGGRKGSAVRNVMTRMDGAGRCVSNTI